MNGLGRAGVVAVVVTVLSWASAFVGIRFAAPWLTPGALSLGRLFVGTITLTLITSLRAFGGSRRLATLRTLPRRERWLVVLIGLAWFAVYNVALNAGEEHVDAGTASMIIQIAPVLIAVLAGTLLHEGFPRPLVVGTAVALLGTLMIGVATGAAGAEGRPAGSEPLLGVLLVLVSAVVYAVALVAQKVVLRRLSGLLVTWAACTVGFVACLPFAGQLVRGLAAAPASVWWAVVYLGVVPTAIAFSTWAFALGRSDAGRLSVTTYAVPPVAIALGWLLLGEVPLLLAVVGGAVSLVGVAVARRPSRPLPAPPA
ncbi:DMT family transporter [Microlunatus spumicola]|uniref:DMT family transporter n=1 Tax=Microlunatus spumicola TaxID=81499 RepID=A0ABP6XMU4_9ACTN